MGKTLSGKELAGLIEQVFRPRASDKALALLVDLPDAAVPDRPAWRERREMAAGWVKKLVSQKVRTPPEVRLFLYRNVRTNNADLPLGAWSETPDPQPASADDLDPREQRPFSSIFENHSLLIAPTEFSATAPLKLAAKKYGFRAATMPGFASSMVPALRLDYREIHRRVTRLTDLLTWAEGANLVFRVDQSVRYTLFLDLRYREAHKSSGLLHEPGEAGNLPSGEAYIVPYEGEREGDQSRSAGKLPVQIGNEVVVYTIENNRALGVEGSGEQAQKESVLLAGEPGYRNIAELGLGVLAGLGVKPVGEVLLDEKLGLHIAFGRSDHFGGQVGPAQFSKPEAVIHLDRVYLPEIQPRIRVETVDLQMPDSTSTPLIREDRFVIDFDHPD